MNKKISVIFVEIHHLVITIIYENCKNKTIVAVNEPAGASRQKHAAVRRLQIAYCECNYPLHPCQYAQKRAPTVVDALFSLNQRLPILPGRFQPSTFGVYGLNCCVRHGNRWIPVAIVTELCCRARALTTTWKSIYSVLTFLTRTS